MKEKKKLKFKKFYFHPVTTFILLTVGVIIMSGICSAFEMQATYNTVNVNTRELEPTLIVVESLLNLNGIKYIFSNAMKTFLSFSPLGGIILALLAISIAEATGFIETFTRRKLAKMPRYTLTFIIMFLSISSSLLNDVGYVILIPLVALIYFINHRNPIFGIVTAYCGVAFGYGISIFVGSQEIALMEYTKKAAILIDKSAHIPLTSNLIFCIIATIIMSIIGTIILEKLIGPKIGKYKVSEEVANSEQYSVIDLEEVEQQEIEKEKHEKSGLRAALIATIIFGLIIIYALIPNLPGSGLLLDMNEKIYVNQVFGPNAYLKNSCTYIVCIYLMIVSLIYGLFAKTLKSDKDLIDKINNRFSKAGGLFLTLFAASQFIAVYKKTNIGIIITTWLGKILEYVEMDGVILIIATLLIIALANIFLSSPTNKWILLSPIVVPTFMQANISPEFAQIVMRVGNSMTNGISPILPAFALFIGYLNIYNLNKTKPITIKQSLQMISPYFLLISITWIILVIGWFMIGIPIGPKIFPTF